ncbi:MAG TPA: hypothetical protein DD761_02120, partial [Cyanobacteria bacterium UBA11691]|nr:hypothetical protein [Cyanobacteria bacterium UBA11691]
MSVNEYIDSVRGALQRLEDYGLVEAIAFNSEVRAGGQALLNIKITLIDKSQLYIREYVTTSASKHDLNRVSYAYQYQSEDTSLIFRYDNAQHKPALGFDEHTALRAV